MANFTEQALELSIMTLLEQQQYTHLDGETIERDTREVLLKSELRHFLRKKYRKDGSSYKKWGCFTATTEGVRHTDSMGNEIGCDIGMLIRDETALEILKKGVALLKLDTSRIIENVSAAAAEAILAGENGGLDNEERLEYSIGRINKKKEDVLDAFFTGTITKEEMRMVNEKYDKELSGLNERLQAIRKRQELRYDLDTLTGDIRKEVTSIVKGEKDSEVFYKNLLDHLIVYPGNRVELRLNLLPHKWTFVLGKLHEIRQKSGVCNNDSEIYPKNANPKTPMNTGFSTPVLHYDSSVPTSVSIPTTSRYGIE